MHCLVLISYTHYIFIIITWHNLNSDVNMNIVFVYVMMNATKGTIHELER